MQLAVMARPNQPPWVVRWAAVAAVADPITMHYAPEGLGGQAFVVPVVGAAVVATARRAKDRAGRQVPGVKRQRAAGVLAVVVGQLAETVTVTPKGAETAAAVVADRVLTAVLAVRAEVLAAVAADQAVIMQAIPRESALAENVESGHGEDDMAIEILDDDDLNNIDLALRTSEDVMEEYVKAAQAGLDVEAGRRRLEEVTVKLRNIKTVYFPGR